MKSSGASEEDNTPAILNALGWLKDPDSVGPLIALLGEHYGGLSRDVACALGMIGDLRALEPLIQALGGQGSWEFKAKCAEALAALGGERALRAIVDLACSEPEAAEDAIGCATAILIRDAQQLSADCLETVFNLQGVVKLVTVEIAHDYRSNIDVPVDCSRLKELASVELQRRLEGGSR